MGMICSQHAVGSLRDINPKHVYYRPMPTGTQAAPGPFARATSAEIRAVMARKRMSGTHLAAAAGMSQSYISRRLLDQASFSINDIEPICEALDQELCPFLTSVLRSMDN